MAVIQIPSKNIYSMENPKVVDNQIDKIEVQAKKGVVEIAEKTVFNDEIQPYSTFAGSTEQDKQNGGWVKVGGGIDCFFFGYVDVKLQPSYKKYKITIPINDKGNYYIKKIIDYKNENGNANINYSIAGAKETGEMTGSLVAYIRTTTAQSPFCEINEIISYNISSPTNIKTDNNIIINYDDTLKTITETERYNSTYFITAKTSVDDLTNVADINAIFNEKDDCYELEFQVLTDLERTSIKGQLQDVKIGDRDGNTIPLTGTYEKYTATQISLTVKGIVVELNLEDEVLTINKNGTEVMSFSGNELMQKTNTPSLETQHQAVINEWKNGKETAVIRCSIDDYYDEKGEKVININDDLTEKSISQNVEGQTGSFQSPMGYRASGSVFVGIGEIKDLQIDAIVGGRPTVSYDQSTGYVFWTIYSSAPYSTVSALITGKLQIEEKLPMTFTVGDVVIPYVYGANGQDKPMSTNIDGTPKKFAVVGKKPISNGAVWQELTLQEK